VVGAGIDELAAEPVPEPAAEEPAAEDDAAEDPAADVADAGEDVAADVAADDDPDELFDEQPATASTATNAAAVVESSTDRFIAFPFN
jgi:hypothetical protein